MLHFRIDLFWWSCSQGLGTVPRMYCIPVQIRAVGRGGRRITLQFWTHQLLLPISFIFIFNFLQHNNETMWERLCTEFYSEDTLGSTKLSALHSFVTTIHKIPNFKESFWDQYVYSYTSFKYVTKGDMYVKVKGDFWGKYRSRILR